MCLSWFGGAERRGRRGDIAGGGAGRAACEALDHVWLARRDLHPGAIIDNGSESMTHEDAVKELQRMMLEDEERSKAEPVGVAIGHHGYGAGQRVSIQWKHDYFPSIGTKFYTTPPKPVEQEPVRITDTMALSFHHALTDGACSDAEVEEIKIGLRAAFADAPVPKPDTEADIARYREVLKEN